MKNSFKILGILAVSIIVIFSFAYSRSANSGWLGAGVQSVDSDLADRYDLDVKYGVLINDVVRNSPADDADLEEGDVIVAYNGNKVFDFDDLTDYLDDSKRNDKVILTIYREGDKFDVNVKLDKSTRYYQKRRGYNFNFDDDFDFDFDDNFYVYTPKAPKAPRALRAPVALRAPRAPRAPRISNSVVDLTSYAGSSSRYRYSTRDRAFMGVLLSDLSDQLGEYFGVKRGRGVLITEVVEDSPAEEAGLVAGDVITSIDNEKMYEYSDIQEVLGDYEPGDEVSISFIRNKKSKEIKLTLDEDDDYDDNRFYFNVPDISFDIPQMRGLSQGYFRVDDFDFDDDDLDEILEELEEYLDNLDEFNDEIDDLDEKIDRKLRREIERYLDDIDDFQDELEEFEVNDNRKIRRELKKLEKEIKKIRKRL